LKINKLKIMKNLYIKIAYIFSLSVFALFSTIGCNKDITEKGTDWEALTPAKLDENGGTWKPCVLTPTDDIKIPDAVATTTPQYLAEIQELKTTQANLTEEQKTAIKYWSAGVTLRWNEIMRALVAKYNLAPQNNADGTYPVPDANNPFNYPVFPFSNPPYAARAYAYVSVAQYDALVAAYKLKKQYNRAAPYKIDATITPSVSKSDLPSYPCEDAVLASATLEMMKFLFPGEIEFLTKKADESRNYKLWAGAAVKSDIIAGDSVGRAVALKVLAKAKSDNMKNALGTQAKWDSLAQNRIALGEEPWKSMESPARPPMLPFYGNVRVWLIPSVATVRPLPPVSTKSAEIKAQLAEVKSFTEKPSRENLAIVHFWADGTGTQTPPGHWNAVACDDIKTAKMSEIRTARNLALLNMALMDAAISCWDTKSFYYYPRPSQLDNSIKTLTGLPNFPSYTSGHSTFSGAAATVLAYIFPNNKGTYDGLAKDASNSRLFGGIHYRMDCETGLQVGTKIGNYAIDRARTDGAD
jgi:PAP2 superfamily